MPWTTYDADRPSLIYRLTTDPCSLLPDLERRLMKARSGERLRIHGMLVAAYGKLGDHEAASRAITSGDDISPRLARALAYGEFTTYAASYLAQNGQPLNAVSRLNEALDMVAIAQSKKPTTKEGQCIYRRRAIVHADLYVTRGLTHFHCFFNLEQSQADGTSALDVLPQPSARFRQGTSDLIDRTTGAALALVAVSLIDGASARCSEQLLDEAEQRIENAPPVTHAQLARCRALIAAKQGDVDRAEIFLAEALHLCIEADARREYDQTLEILANLRKARADRIRAHWEQQWIKSKH